MKFLQKILLRFLPCVFDPAGMNQKHFGTSTLWLYKTVDPIATVIGSGYFNPYAELVKNGDVIIVSDTNVPTIDVLAVTSADGASTVTTLNGT